MKFWTALLSLLAACVPLVAKYLKDRAAVKSPDERAEDDIKKVNDAIANHDSGVINDQFNKL